jgi:hypothetical protein
VGSRARGQVGSTSFSRALTCQNDYDREMVGPSITFTITVCSQPFPCLSEFEHDL